MKNIQYLLTLLFFILCISCTKEDPNIPKPSPFKVVASTTSIGSEGGTITFSITAGRDGWWITYPNGTPTWLSISRIFGSGDYTLPVVVQPNKTGTSRNISISVNPTFGLAPVPIIVTQQ
jgi:Putative binding domain, N-terminal